LEELDFADTDICLVEHSKEENWIFNYEKKNYKQGKCDWCNSYRYLIIICKCNEVKNFIIFYFFNFKIGYCSPKCQSNDKDYHRKRCKKYEDDEDKMLSQYSKESVRGLCGLQNLGNTCFMNSSLQCISNCYELTEYFLKDFHVKDVNTDNPLGSGGDLCKAYSALLKNMWYGRNNSFSPWNFKRSISGFQTMFSGYQQHDSQEFLNFLLDGLHEDLNRVIKKPFVEKDETSRPDDLKSKDCWIGFLRRNQSIFTDLFYGLFKSTLYCPDCENISTCFDPFLSVSLPLAAKTETYEILVNFVFFDMKVAPLKISLQFNSETTLIAVRNKIAKILNIHPFSFLVVKYDTSSTSGNNGVQGPVFSGIDYFLNSHNLVKPQNSFYSQNEKKTYYCIEFDPKVFYSIENNNYFKNYDEKKIEEEFPEVNKNRKNISNELLNNKKKYSYLFTSNYDEDESGETSESISYYSKQINKDYYSLHLDENHGFKENLIPVLIYFSKYETNFNKMTSMGRRSKFLSPRVVYLNKNWKLDFVHFYLFKYVQVFYSSGNPDGEEMELSEEELHKYFLKTFAEYNTEEENDNAIYQKKMNWPYRIRLKKTSTDTRLSNLKGDCTYCNKSDCHDCLLPYSEEKTLGEFMEIIPNSHYNNKALDNTYYYLADRYRNYINLNNLDFALDLSFMEEEAKKVENLLEYVNIDFKVSKEKTNKNLDVLDCFKNFVKLEKLEANNEWYCPHCKNHVRATKKMEIYNAPNILIIHLKRFKNNSKIDTLIDFPVDDLDISEFVVNKTEGENFNYELFAVSNHFGSMGFGHYTAFAKNKFSGNWYDFDDSSVSKKSQNDIVSKGAYVLFYRKKNMENKVNLKDLYEKKFENWEEYVQNNQVKKEDKMDIDQS